MSVGENKKHLFLVWSNVWKKTALAIIRIYGSTLEIHMQELYAVRKDKKQASLPWILAVFLTSFCQRGA